MVNKAGIIDFRSIYGFFDGFLPESLDWLVFVIAGLSLAIIVVMSAILATAGNTWIERRVLGRYQSRLGPNRTGPFGLIQPFADVFKLLMKEDTTPKDADPILFKLAPIVFVVPGVLVFSVIPFGPNSFLGKLNIGIAFIVGITSLNTLGVMMGGWASRNKYAMFGTMRGVAMLISYEVPMVLALTGIVLLAGSLSLFQIVLNQDIPFLLVAPLGFLVYIIAASAEINRAPFDLIEADSELTGGYLTEFSGIKFGLLQLTEFMAPIVISTVAAVLFLGGTRGFAPIPGQVWFILKVIGVMWVLLWFRATFPRLRVDQVMGFAWKALFPLAMLNIFVLAVEIVLLQDRATGILSNGDLWIMTIMNWCITIVAVVVVANVLGQRKLKRPEPVPSPLANMYVEAE